MRQPHAALQTLFFIFLLTLLFFFLFMFNFLALALSIIILIVFIFFKNVERFTILRVILAMLIFSESFKF